MLFNPRFDGFEWSDFKAFEHRKWSSNLFNLERLVVRDRLKALGRALENTVAPLAAFLWDVTSHTPSIFNGKKVSDLTLFFSRTDEQKKAILPLLDSKIALPDQIADAAEHHRHVNLGVRVSENGVQTGMMLHSTAWLDVMNLLNRVRKQSGADDFLELLRGLPAGAFMRVGPEVDVLVAELTADHLRSVEDNVLNNVFDIVVGWSFGLDRSEILSAEFLHVCQDRLESLVPVWHFVAWRPQSDFLQPSTPPRSVKPAPEPKAPEFHPGCRVLIVHGPFEGRSGTMLDLDQKGMVKVLIGKVTLRTDMRSVRVVRS